MINLGNIKNLAFHPAFRETLQNPIGQKVMWWGRVPPIVNFVPDPLRGVGGFVPLLMMKIVKIFPKLHFPRRLIPEI